MSLGVNGTEHTVSQRHNKLFKSDSARVAFLLCVGSSGLGVMRRHRYCVPHTLTRRYANKLNKEDNGTYRME